MTINPIRHRIERGELALSLLTSIPQPTVVELLALAGFDGVIVEMEHSPQDAGDIRSMIIAGELSGTCTTIRVPSGDWDLIQQYLDFGLQGVQVAHVSTRQQAEDAVEAVRYSPLGRRGAIATSRAARYGDVAWKDHVRTSNEQIFLNLMIEDLEGVENLEAIASVPGVDVVTPGPQDLAEALGVSEPDDPRLRELIENIASRLQKLDGAGLGLSIGHPLLPLSVMTVRSLGAVHSNVLPALERRLLTHLREVVSRLRDEGQQSALSPQS